MTKTATNDATEWATKFKKELPPRIRQLIAQAWTDLYNGPHTEEGYPGFAPACEEISDALDYLSDKWLDVQSGEMLDSEPEAWQEPNDLYDPEDEDSDEPEFFVYEPEETVRFERRDLLDLILGVELAGHM